jgi:ferredoxin
MRAGGLEIATDRTLCIGSENCKTYAPNTFDTDAEGKVVVLAPDADTSDAVRSAVDACPVAALRIVDDAGGSRR